VGWLNISPAINPDPSPTRISLVGSWLGSPDCDLVFLKDDGKVVEGSCDNSGYKHKINGIYSDPWSIKTTLTRIDLNDNCETTTEGFIKIIDNNKLNIGQSGWNGCNIRTGSTSITWNRSQ